MEPNVNQGGHATAGAQPRPFLLHKQRSVAPELERAARVEFTGSVTGAEITQKALIDSAKLQAIATIISRMGSKLAQDIEKGMEMRY